MDRLVYENKRKELTEEAQNFINASNLEEYNKSYEAIQRLDNQYEEETQAQADLDALNKVVNASSIQNVVPVSGIIDGLNVNENIIDGISNKKEEDLYVNAWAKDMMNKPMTDEENSIFNAKNASFTHTTENSGVLIPETVVSGIWKEVEEQYPLWNDVFKTSVKGNLSIIESDESTDAGWYDEGTETEDGKETFKKVTLTGCELSRSITVSWKLREMAISEFIPFIQAQLAQKIGKALGYGVSQGKGKPSESDSFEAEPRGIITALKAEINKPQVIEYDEANPLAYKVCTRAMGLIKSAYKKGSAIYADNMTIWNELANITDSVGRPYFIPDTTTGGVGRMFGLTVKEDDSVPTGDILFGNARAGYHANINKQIILDSEDHKKRRVTDHIAYGIVDGDVRTTKAFAIISKKQSTKAKS